jgi:hypothetical protein
MGVLVVALVWGEGAGPTVHQGACAVGESSLVCLLVSLFVALDHCIKKTAQPFDLDVNIKCKPFEKWAKLWPVAAERLG